MNITEEMMQLAESLQEDCQQHAEAILKHTQSATYETTTNVWMFLKLAELQVRIKQLEDRSI